MLRSSLCDYMDAYILVSGTIAITRAGANDAANRVEEGEKGVIFKNHWRKPFTDCISEINNSQIDNAKDIDILISM